MRGGDGDIQGGVAGGGEVDVLEGLAHPLAQLFLVLLPGGQRQEGLGHVVVGAGAVVLHLDAHHAHPRHRYAVLHLGAGDCLEHLVEGEGKRDRRVRLVSLFDSDFLQSSFSFFFFSFAGNKI